MTAKVSSPPLNFGTMLILFLVREVKDFGGESGVFLSLQSLSTTVDKVVVGIHVEMY